MGLSRCRWLVALAMSWMALVAPWSAAADSLTLDQAIAIAEQHNASLRAARALESAAQGELKDARAPLWNNLEITMERRQRLLSQSGTSPAQRHDTGIGLNQTFELAGQQSARRGAANAGWRAVEHTIEGTRREVRAEAATRFIQVLNLQQRVQIEEQAVEVLQRAAELVGKRVEAGEDSRLDGNLALVEAERAANQFAQAKEQLVQARGSLSTFLQLDPGFVPEATGDLDALPADFTLSQLLASAAKRPGVQALAAREEAARRRLDLERGAVYPDLTVGLSYSPEQGIDGTDRITTLSLSLPVPLFRRNATGIGRALTELDQATIERQAAEQATRATVTALWERLESLRQRVDRLRTVVLPGLEENQQLSVKALQAGEIGLPQFLLVRRQVLDSQRDLLDARTELLLTHIAVEHAAGWPEELAPLEAGRPLDRQP